MSSIMYSIGISSLPTSSTLIKSVNDIKIPSIPAIAPPNRPPIPASVVFNSSPPNTSPIETPLIRHIP